MRCVHVQALGGVCNCERAHASKPWQHIFSTAMSSMHLFRTHNPSSFDECLSSGRRDTEDAVFLAQRYSSRRFCCMLARTWSSTLSVPSKTLGATLAGLVANGGGPGMGTKGGACRGGELWVGRPDAAQAELAGKRSPPRLDRQAKAICREARSLGLGREWGYHHLKHD